MHVKVTARRSGQPSPASDATVEARSNSSTTPRHGRCERAGCCRQDAHVGDARRARYGERCEGARGSSHGHRHTAPVHGAPAILDVQPTYVHAGHDYAAVRAAAAAAAPGPYTPTPYYAALAGPAPLRRPHPLAPASPWHELGAGPQPLFGWASVTPLAHGYGMPRYARRVKPDYRRFCVSVGKAEVPIASLPGGPLEGMPAWMASMIV